MAQEGGSHSSQNSALQGFTLTHVTPWNKPAEGKDALLPASDTGHETGSWHEGRLAAWLPPDESQGTWSTWLG